MLLISDKQRHVDTLSQYLTSVYAVSYHELLASNAWRSKLPSIKLVWFDLPEGKNYATTKMRALDDALHMIIHQCKDRQIACVSALPFVRSDTNFQQHRWQRLLKTWGRPKSTVVCSCRLALFAKKEPVYHTKVRLFGSGCKLRESNCSQQPDPNIRFSGNTATLMMVSLFAEKFIDLGSSSSGAADALLSTLVVGNYKLMVTDLTHVGLAPHGPQESPDSAGTFHSDQSQGGSYPTDSKERQQQQKKKDKEAGITREVKKIIKPVEDHHDCLLYTSPSPRDMRRSRMPSSA